MIQTGIVSIECGQLRQSKTIDLVLGETVSLFALKVNADRPKLQESAETDCWAVMEQHLSINSGSDASTPLRVSTSCLVSSGRRFLY